VVIDNSSVYGLCLFGCDDIGDRFHMVFVITDQGYHLAGDGKV